MFSKDKPKPVKAAGSAAPSILSTDYALIRGKVVGRIRAHNVTLALTARVMGDVIHESLMIEPGAFIEGRCERLDSVITDTDKRLNLAVSEPPSRPG